MENSLLPFVPDGWLLLAGAWVLTYLIHSTALLGGVWAFTAGRWIRSDALKERLWKFALVGGLITATLQMCSDVEPLSGRFLFKEIPSGTPVHVKPDSAIPTVHEDALIFEEEEEFLILSEVSEGDYVLSRLPMDGSAPSSLKSEIAWRRYFTAWPRYFVGFCLVGAFFALAMLGWNCLRFRFNLGQRSELCSGPLKRMLDSLCLHSGFQRRVRLTVSAKSRVPMAMGIVRHEICLPERALTALSPAEQESMIAHELAHLKRYDPLWLALFRWMESLLFFQPLNRLARDRWLEAAEYCCDAWAAKLLGEGLPLARCLTEVADWIVGPDVGLVKAAAHGMARNPSSLARRVTRLLEAPKEEARFVRGPMPGVILAALLFIMVGTAPGVSVNEQAGKGEEDEKIVFEDGPISQEHALSGTLPDIVLEDGPVLRERAFAGVLPSIVLGDGPVPRGQAFAGVLTDVEAALAGLDEEIIRLRSAIREAGLMNELGSLIREAENRSRVLHAKKNRVRSLIRRMAGSSESTETLSHSRSIKIKE